MAKKKPTKEQQVADLVTRVASSMAEPINRNLGNKLTQELGRGIYGALVDELNKLSAEIQNVLDQ